MFLKLCVDGSVERLETNKFEEINVQKELDCDFWERVRMNHNYSLIVDDCGAINGKLLNELAQAQWAILCHAKDPTGYEIYGDAIIVQEGREDFQPVNIVQLTDETLEGIRWVHPELICEEDKGEEL